MFSGELDIQGVTDFINHGLRSGSTNHLLQIIK